MEALLKLPGNWHVVVTDENRELVRKWADGIINHSGSYEKGYCYGMKGSEIDSSFPQDSHLMGQEISTADFKRLVLGEKNFGDYGVVGGEDLTIEFNKNAIVCFGGHKNFIYFKLTDEKVKFNEAWTGEYLSDTSRQTLPLQEYLKLLPTENMGNEVQITKTWETVYFKNNNATIELTLNHEKKSFDLQTASEEMVSFKKDTIESAREKLKCIESALIYAEINLNK